MAGAMWRMAAVVLVAASLRAAGQQAAKPAEAPTQAAGTAPGAVKAAAVATPVTAKEAHDALIAADTQKLLALAEELKAEVAKSSKDTLSIAVIKKAGEVEKLAHALKEELKK